MTSSETQPAAVGAGLAAPPVPTSQSASREMSRSNTVSSSIHLDESPTRTLTDLAPAKGSPDSPIKELSALAEKDVLPTPTSIALSSLPRGRKNLLMLAFCASMFLDAAGVSATFLMTAPISHELNIPFADEAWILASYSMVFAATLLFSGRLADLYPPHRLYIIGFFGLGILNLVVSFLTEKYSFYVIRALSALLAVLTIPSSINCIVQMYPDQEEQAKKLALFGMSGALANTIALVLAGVFMLASWRWYFRFVAIVAIPISIGAWYLLPETQAVAGDLKGSEKWKRMDLGGVAMLVIALILFVLGFTQAPIQGWNSAIFIAPFVISIVLFAAFIVYEQWMPKGFTLLPHGIWSYPNIFPLIIQATAIFCWMACAQLRIAGYFQTALGMSPIETAARLLPMGGIALIVGTLTQFAPWLITRPRYVQPIASLFCFIGSMLFAFSGGGHGDDYYKYMLTGMLIGTAGGMIIFIGMNTLIIQSFPLEAAGVGGSFANVLFQVGGVVGIAIQAGLIATGDGTVEDWTGSANGYYFTSAFVLLTGIVFVLWYRQEKMPKMGQSVVAV